MSSVTERKTRIRSVIGELNAIGPGEFGAIVGKLKIAEDALADLGESGLLAIVAEARGQLSRGDLANYRRLISQAVARLGHLG